MGNQTTCDLGHPFRDISIPKQRNRKMVIVLILKLKKKNHFIKKERFVARQIQMLFV